MIFVFGSNESGRHGKGAALFAYRECGAVYGRGRGLQGNSYAIPTKDGNLRVRCQGDILKDVREFKEFAWKHPELKFKVTRVGCGLAGYSDVQMQAMFIGSPENCYFDPLWAQFGFKVWEKGA